MNQQEQEQLRRLLAGYVSNSPRMSMLSPQTAALGASPSPRHVSPDDLLSLATLQAEQRRLMLARMQSARSLGLMQAPNLMANAPTPAFLPQQPPMQQHFVPNAQPPAASHLPNIMPTLAPPRQQVAVPSQIPIVDHSERSSAMSVSARGGADNPHRVYVDVIRENDVLCGTCNTFQCPTDATSVAHPFTFRRTRRQKQQPPRQQAIPPCD